jgi:hypothetical protein
VQLQDFGSVGCALPCRHPAHGAIEAISGHAGVGRSCHPDSRGACSAERFDDKGQQVPSDSLASTSTINGETDDLS